MPSLVIFSFNWWAISEGVSMASTMIKYICMFLLVLFFLCIIFLYMEDGDGTNNASDERQSHALIPEVPADFGVLPGPEVRYASSSATKASETPQLVEELEDDTRKLLAVFHAYSSLASAVILTEGHGANRYRVGEALPGGGALLAIYPGKVLIGEGERRVTLRIALMAPGEQTQSVSTGKNDVEERRNDGPRMAWQVGHMLSTLDLRPISDDSPEGYLFGDGLPEVWREEFGVEPGDVILAVNGYPVGEYSSNYLVWLSFKDTHRASVLVRKQDGAEFTIYYPEDVKGVSLPRR
ncbi:hypothetical protein K8B33_05405 [Alcanivorax sp. JB21]|uniref:type II secretion system protein N n=1 Tax=Alcanivorax limicola TaxID=2874102 RepID=UPI001CBBCAD8|nr:type II secretion system protein N [Alcanivorax limicola]MBZ2188521.1 hypothetical protein [Alcanivorax limicola]